MSMCRVNRVDKARKDQGTCGKCGEEILAGSPYVWWKGRYTAKRVRCLKASCQPEPWERETNPLRATHMQAEDAVAGAQNAWAAEEAVEFLETAKGLVEEVIDSLEERISGWEGTGLENSQQYESCSYSRDDLQSWVDSCDGWIGDLEEFRDVDGEEGEEADEDDGLASELALGDILNQIEDVPELDLGA